MSEVKKVAFGTINDSDKSLQSAAAGTFGLNVGRVSVFKFNPNAGANDSPGDAVDITVVVSDKEFKTRIFDVTKVFDSKGNEITDTNSEAFIKAYNSTMTQNMAVIVHFAKALGVTQERLDAAFAQPKNSFAEWATTVISLVDTGFENKLVDVFLEYQWNISEGQDKTYLQLPRNMKGGYFVVPHVTPQGAWKEENSWVENNQQKEGLRYVNNANNQHPFTRNKAFMESPKAIRQIDGQDAPTSSSPAGNAGEQPKRSFW